LTLPNSVRGKCRLHKQADGLLVGSVNRRHIHVRRHIKAKNITGIRLGQLPHRRREGGPGGPGGNLLTDFKVTVQPAADGKQAGQATDPQATFEQPIFSLATWRPKSGWAVDRNRRGPHCRL
jgi:hypothetical protein